MNIDLGAVETVGEAIVEFLRARKVECIFGGAPTSMIEALAKSQLSKEVSLRGIITPHEQCAVAMAHGYYAASGRPQAVYLYSTVGTANGLGGIINASRARIPMIIIAARSPISERRGVPGSRDIHVQWSQESFDQAAMVREFVKWDYEIRQPGQVASVMERAYEVALAEPCGPVYISVPRDVLAAPLVDFPATLPAQRITAARIIPDPSLLDVAADLIVNARNPIIVTSEAGRTAGGRTELARLSHAGAIGVLEASPVYSNLDPKHPCHLGYVFASQVSPELELADVILVVESDVPWFTARVTVPASAKVIQLGVDPFYQSLPMRGFPCDVPLIGHAESGLRELSTRITNRIPQDVLTTRLNAHRARREQRAEDLAKTIKRDAKLTEITSIWANHCLGQLLDNDTIVVNEYPVDLRIVHPSGPGSYYGPSHAGGLGWGLGAALGVKMAQPEKTVVCALGDGAYYYCVPTSCHHISAAEQLPMLTVVFNNGGWNEVRKSVISTHPDGFAAKANEVPMTQFGVQARLEDIVSSFGGYGVAVNSPENLASTLREALRVVREEGRQALVNIRVRV